jgi:predicted Zn-dependent peptidase
MKIVLFLMMVLWSLNGQANSLNLQEKQTSGMKVWTFHHNQNPLIGMCLIFPHGTTSESEALDGACHVMNSVLFEGTPKYPNEKLRDFLDNHGLKISVSHQLNHTKVFMLCPTTELPFLFEAMAEIFANPLFPEDRLAHVKRLTISSLKGLGESQHYHMDQVFKQIACKGHACERSHVGSEKTLEALTSPALKEVFQKIYNRDGLKVVMGGDLTKDRVEQMCTFF